MTSARSYDLIVFDLDGVITTEHIYWECARLTLWELLYVWLEAVRPYVQAVHDRVAREAILPDELIFRIKNRAINSNWDLTFLGVCALIASARGRVTTPVDSPDALWNALRPALGGIAWPAALDSLLDQAGELRGPDLLAFAGQAASKASGVPETWFGLEGPIWQATYERFQLWYTGQLTGVWGAAPLAERPVIALADIQTALADLAGQGYTLGVATGRPRDEALTPLKQFGVLDCFEPGRIATYDDVQAAQRMTGTNGLGKPHPFVVRKALFPAAAIEALAAGDVPVLTQRALMVGDSASDALAAQAAGIPCLGVLSGVHGEAAAQERRAALLAAGCVDVVADVRAVPDWLSRQAGG